jgi:hypothetical protein
MLTQPLSVLTQPRWAPTWATATWCCWRSQEWQHKVRLFLLSHNGCLMLAACTRAGDIYLSTKQQRQHKLSLVCQRVQAAGVCDSAAIMATAQDECLPWQQRPGASRGARSSSTRWFMFVFLGDTSEQSLLQFWYACHLQFMTILSTCIVIGFAGACGIMTRMAQWECCRVLTQQQWLDTVALCLADRRS